jgi:two-component system, chemotaxis family, chemotaxis protein CheY
LAKILIVDDSAMSRRILRSILESAGHHVTEAEDGMIALEKFFLDKPDLVLLDLIMKGMVGMEVLKQVRLMDKKARIIIATADIQHSTRAITQAEGAAAFVTKPFLSEEILKTVNSVLEGQSNGSD